jgi:hypothetical protein
MDTNMHNPIVRETPALIFQALRQSPPLGLAGPPSFARALWQRGLIAETPAAEWNRVASIFEAHLRRQAMEQAFAEMRGDAS